MNLNEIQSSVKNLLKNNNYFICYGDIVRQTSNGFCSRVSACEILELIQKSQEDLYISATNGSMCIQLGITPYHKINPLKYIQELSQKAIETSDSNIKERISKAIFELSCLNTSSITNTGIRDLKYNDILSQYPDLLP